MKVSKLLRELQIWSEYGSHRVAIFITDKFGSIDHEVETFTLNYTHNSTSLIEKEEAGFTISELITFLELCNQHSIIHIFTNKGVVNPSTVYVEFVDGRLVIGGEKKLL